MNRDNEKRIAAKMVKTLAMMCVRNTGLETLHAGVVPVTHTGDYSDVRVIDADGRKIAWNDVSHLDDGQIRALMTEIVSRLYPIHMLRHDFEVRDSLEIWALPYTPSPKWQYRDSLIVEAGDYDAPAGLVRAF